MIQNQSLVTNLKGIVEQLVRIIYNQILRVKVLRSCQFNLSVHPPQNTKIFTWDSRTILLFFCPVLSLTFCTNSFTRISRKQNTWYTYCISIEQKKRNNSTTSTTTISKNTPSSYKEDIKISQAQVTTVTRVMMGWPVHTGSTEWDQKWW